MPSVLVRCKLRISQAVQGVICSASKMGGYISNNLEEMVALNDFFNDFECVCVSCGHLQDRGKPLNLMVDIARKVII